MGTAATLSGMPFARNLIVLLVCLLIPACGRADQDEALLIKPLIEPAKLQTLGDRGANPRIQKATAILWQAKSRGKDPAKIAGRAVELIGWKDTEKGRMTADALVRNLTIAERLGSVTDEDIAEMARGRAATVRAGPYKGQVLSVDHIIPRAVAPELDNVIANLELMPLALNQGKGDKVTSRQVALARKLHAEGMLSAAGLARVLAEAK